MKLKFFLSRLVVFMCITSMTSYLHAQWATNGSSIVYTTDKVGIGTSSPGSILEARSTSTTEMRLYAYSASTIARLWSMNSTFSYGFGIGTDNRGHIYQNVNNPSVVMTFYNEKVGIGTTSPSYLLHVNGSLGSSSLTTGSITASSLNASGNAYCNYLYVNWNVNAWNMYAYNYYTRSDAKLKKNISSIDNSLDLITSLKGREYFLKNAKSPESTDKKNYGFIAQEIQEILPEIVSEDDEGYLAVNYTSIIPILVEAIKEQQDEIESYQQKIERLENKIESIEQATLTYLNSSNNPQLNNYPNPFEGETNLSFSLPENTLSARIDIFDSEGILVRSVNIKSAEETEITLDCSELIPGIYSYSLVADNKVLNTNRMLIR